MSTNANNFHEMPKLIPALIFVVVAIVVITNERKAPVKIDVVPSSKQVTEEVTPRAIWEPDVTTAVVASSPYKTGEVRRINFTVLPRLGNGTNR